MGGHGDSDSKARGFGCAMQKSVTLPLHCHILPNSQKLVLDLQKFNDHLLNQGFEHLYEPVHLLPAHKYVIMTILM